MAYGDTNYNLYHTGSATVASSGSLFGNYQGLSALNVAEVVNIDLYAIGANAYYVAPSTLGNNAGIKVYSGTSPVSLYPMQARNASVLMAHSVGGDASPMWAIWQRNP